MLVVVMVLQLTLIHIMMDMWFILQILQNRVLETEDALKNIVWEDTPASTKFKLELEDTLKDAKLSLQEYKRELKLLTDLDKTLDALDEIQPKSIKIVTRIVHDFSDSDKELDIDFGIIEDVNDQCMYSKFQ